MSAPSSAQDSEQVLHEKIEPTIRHDNQTLPQMDEISASVAIPLPPSPDGEEEDDDDDDDVLNVPELESEPLLASDTRPVDRWVHDIGDVDKRGGQEWAQTALLDEQRELRNGTFAVRKHRNDNAYVLELVYKNRMTSHFIEIEAEDGIITISKRQYGYASTLNELIDTLATEPLPEDRKGKAWPIRLVRGVDPRTGRLVNVPEMQDSKGQAVSKSKPAPVSPVSQAAASGDGRPWHHGVSKGKDGDAAVLQDPVCAAPYPDGTFTVCDLDSGSSNYPGHVFNICFKNKVTRHLVKDYGEGLVVNKRSYGNLPTVDDMVAAFSATVLPAGWPIRLTQTVDAISKTLIQMIEPAEVSKVASSGSRGTANKKWFFPVVDGVELKRADAERKLAKGNDYPAGQFVIREHITEGGLAEQWVLSVNYKGKPTHHLIERSSVSGMLTVNRKQYGCQWNSVTELVDGLSQSNVPQGWPVQLVP